MAGAAGSAEAAGAAEAAEAVGVAEAAEAAGTAGATGAAVDLQPTGGLRSAAGAELFLVSRFISFPYEQIRRFALTQLGQ